MEKTITVKVFKFDPTKDSRPTFKKYEVPFVPHQTVMDVLDYIYNNLDSTIAYFSHAACRRSVCGRCTILVNGKASLACQRRANEDLVLEPLKGDRVLRDLVST
jgi:succinate dehydrogenase/fumarate reductase-like Fe-S protein